MSTLTRPLPVAICEQSLTGLIAHIVDRHHGFLRTELPFLEARIAKLCAKHGHDRPELFAIQQTLQDLADDLNAHLKKEEQVLFPYIRGLEQARSTGDRGPQACFPSVRCPIRMMLVEHDAAQDLLATLRRTTNQYSAPGFVCHCGAEFYSRLEKLESDLSEHIRLENEVLFPAAMDLEDKGQ